MAETRLRSFHERLDDLVLDTNLSISRLEGTEASDRMPALTQIALSMGRVLGFLEAAAILQPGLGEGPARRVESIVGELEAVAQLLHVPI